MAQAQLTRNELDLKTKIEITTDQSQKLVQNLVSMSLGCVAFLRNLFGDDNFADQRFVPEKVSPDYNKTKSRKKNSLKVKTLIRGITSEADTFLDWVEKGIYHAIDSKYLKAIQFSIFTDLSNPNDLTETYMFKFEYSEVTGDVTMNFDNENKALDSDKSSEKISLLDARKSVQQLMRRFIVVTQSLDPLPDEKYLSMRLLFNDGCPEDYQPPLFKDCSNDKPATVELPIEESPSISDVGNVKTPHNKVFVKILSLPDRSAISASNTSKVDPFDVIDDMSQTHSYVEDQGNHIIIPESLIRHGRLIQKESQITKGLENFLESQQKPHSYDPTQKVIFESEPFDDINAVGRTAGDVAGLLGCNGVGSMCECNLHYSREEDLKMAKCNGCDRNIHVLCYGFYEYRISSAVKNSIHCYSCLCQQQIQEDPPIDLIMLMHLRKFWKLVSKYNIPDTFDKCLNLLKLPIDDPDSESMLHEIINRLILSKVLIVEDEPVLKKTASKTKLQDERGGIAFGSNYIEIEDNCIIKLDKNDKYSFFRKGTYGWTFKPALRGGKASRRKSLNEVKSFFFPEKLVSNIDEIGLIFENKFNTQDTVFFPQAMNDIEEDPIINSTDSESAGGHIFDKDKSYLRNKESQDSFLDDLNDEFSQQLNILTQSQYVPLKGKPRNKQQISENNFTFEESLQLLSQPPSNISRASTSLRNKDLTLNHERKRPIGLLRHDRMDTNTESNATSSYRQKFRKVSVAKKSIYT